MGRVVHVSRTLPSILSSARLIASIEKPNCNSLPTDSPVYDCSSNGELPLCSRSTRNLGFSLYDHSSNAELPLRNRSNSCMSSPTRECAVGAKINACQNSVGGILLVRRFSSGTEFSESDWPETDDECAAGCRRHVVPRPRKNVSHCRSAGHERVGQEQHAAYVTESETDVDVPPTRKEGPCHPTSSRGRVQREQYATESETDVETVPPTWKAGLCHTGSSHVRAQQARQVAYVTKSDTDTEMVANTSQWMETDDEDENLQRMSQKSHNPYLERGAEAGAVSSDWWGLDDDDDAPEQGHGDSASEVDMAESGQSDWVEMDEEQQLQQKWDGLNDSRSEDDGDNVGSSSLSRARDLSHLKTTPYGRAGVAHKVPERPSKKERSAGLSPRTIRDDDSDEVEIESDLEGELQEEIERQMAAEPKFERPSITWGILLTRELRLLAREKVIKYLETEGIDTTELKQIELPTTVEVMQTRLGFLRKIGLDNAAINNYPLVLGCSVYKNMVPVLKYLKKLGFPQPWVPILLKKYPMILHASVVIDILPIIYFLRGLDIDLIDIPRVLTKYPDLLGFKTEGTMSTSVAYLVSVGVNLRHVGHMLTEYPEILGMRVATVIKPKFEYLMSLGIPQLIVAKILERRPHVLGYHLENRMQSNVNELLEVGVRKEAIPGMITQFPELLGRIFTFSVKDHVSWFKEQLQLDTDGVASIIEKMPQVLFMPTAMALERIRFLKSERFTAAEVGLMVTQCPQILISSIYDNLRPNLTFLTKEMKRPRAEVIDFPTFFTYSLEARIKPRFRALTVRQANCSLDWLLNCSDLEFKKRQNAGFSGNEVVGLSFIMGGLLPGKPEKENAEIQSSEDCQAAAL